MEPMMDALVRPLTAKEQEGGIWETPDPRILFEGTLEEAEEFYMQEEIIPQIQNSPVCKYGDGLPIVVPTEERVAAMLKGTSHKPDEILTFQTDHVVDVRHTQMGRTGKKGDPCTFLPMARKATVEKIATIGVMAGCEPRHMPILLAMAEAGGGCGDGRGGMQYVISGPIAREVGMNFDVNVLGPGNRSNRALGRAADLMWRNLGGNIPAVTNCGVQGTGMNNCIPENADALPPGWKGLNEEYDFKNDESVIVHIGGGQGQGWQGSQFSPGGYRAFQKSPHGGIARRLGVKGVPGPKNWIEYLLPSFWRGSEGGITFLMLPEMAYHLYECGFKSKDDVYEWLYQKSFMTVGEYRTHSWPDVWTNAWKGIERVSGKPWKELSDDEMVPAMDSPYQACIIVTGNGEEISLWGGGRTPAVDAAFSIDNWR
ncbi:MAG: hypothetical protein A2158_01200 [Chloroflexi bacterium RBG_13_46_14]|nr:MAG: hypothetical protein A2158_01200 [Chloroflexi bacterium RBG_13_46_14]